MKDIVDLGHPLVRQARDIDWRVLDGWFAGVLLNSVNHFLPHSRSSCLKLSSITTNHLDNLVIRGVRLDRMLRNRDLVIPIRFNQCQN